MKSNSAEGGQNLSPAGSHETADRNQLDFEIEFYSGILAANPSYVEVLRVLSNNLTAKGDHRRCLDYDRRLTQLCPEDRVAHYNLACSYSLLDMIEPALKALKLALELGFEDLDYIREDLDLESVRKDDRFHELLRKFAR